eukprot:TRINITY_DN642_c0_g1_i6.p1 TRINITY_DN642_c0_g1~~TRINITY_DN642_c0_g1_i6.p1  ORF type:complete len:353 (-),score=43.48 TRINITY_DN642_c0_g1_i6:920-1978(-)
MQDLINSMPRTSSYRKFVFGNVLRNYSITEVRLLGLDICEKSLYRYKKAAGDGYIFESVGPRGYNGNRIEDEDIKRIERLWTDECVCLSGQYRIIRNFTTGEEMPRMLQLQTTKKLYYKYVLSGGDCSYYQFKKHKPWYVKNGRSWTKSDFQHSCPVCSNEGGKYSQQEIDEHKEKSKQMMIYRLIKLRLSEEDACIVQDFAKHFFSNMKSFSDLVIVVYYRQNGELKWKYFDFLVPGLKKQMWPYVVTTWNHFWNEFIVGKYKTVYIFSDGGPHHFTVRYTLAYWSYLFDSTPSVERMEYHFFEPHHGENLCDSHTGVIKQKKSRFVKENNRDVFSVDEYVDEIIEGLKNT